MNSPCGMYKVSPILSSNDKVELPNCMYKVENIHGSCGKNLKVEKVDQNVKSLEERQERILRQLDDLKTQLQKIRSQTSLEIPTLISASKKVKCGPSKVGLSIASNERDLVISANPSNPPWSLVILYKLYKDQIRIGAQCHIHSSISSLPDRVKNFFQDCRPSTPRSQQDLFLTVVWKDVGVDPEMMINPITQVPIKGEVNIARYIAHLVGLIDPKADVVQLTDIDTLLDFAYSYITYGSSKERQSALRQLNGRLGKSTWLVGSSTTVADVVLWSALYQVQAMESAPANVKKWLKTCNTMPAFNELCDVNLSV